MKSAVKRKAALFLIVVMCLGLLPNTSYATTTQQKIDKAEKEKDELEGKLDKTNDDLQDLKGEHNSLREKLDELNQQLKEVGVRLEDLENQVTEKQQQITDTLTALEEAKETEKWQYECMKKRIQFMYEHNNSVYLEAILHAENFSDFLNAADFFQQIVEYDQKMLEQYQENRQYIEEEEVRLEAEKTELNNLKQEAEEEKSIIVSLINQTANSITSYADQISDAEKEAYAYEEKIRQKEEDLEYLNKKLEEERAMSLAAANGTWRDISEVSFAEGDRYLLANLIYCEAGAEPYAGQVAVGAVVMNRVLSSVYPDSIVGVIYQSGQFSPVASGRLALALSANKATEDCYRAADEAMAGITNVGNCVYFRTPIEGLTGISIGGHIFY